MHVAILCEYGTINGGENSILAMIEQMADVEVTVLAPPHGRLASRLDQCGINHVACSLVDDAGRRMGREAVLDRLREITNRIRPDLLHANSLSMGRLTGALRPSLAIPTSAHLRDIMRLNRSTIGDLNGNDALIAVSRETARHHIGQGLDERRTRVIYNGIDPTLFQRAGNTEELHRQLGLPDTARIVASIGQITLRKGQDVFVAAAIASAAALPDVHWLIVGERYSDKPEIVAFDQQMRQQVAAAGLSERVHWLGYRQDVPRLLGEIDLLVHSARQEPLGRVLLEAGAAGVPIIATNVGGTAEIIDDGHSGLLIPPDDPQAIVHAVTTLLDDRDRCRLFGQAAQESVTQRFGVVLRTAELVDLWRQPA